jgi:hypothetical protein
MEKLTELPKDLPIPVDDGACDHLVGESLPSIGTRKFISHLRLRHHLLLPNDRQTWGIITSWVG